ncbi:hypothetical protein BGX20_006152, partial [Mortierella sp. AD010]
INLDHNHEMTLRTKRAPLTNLVVNTIQILADTGTDDIATLVGKLEIKFDGRQYDSGQVSAYVDRYQKKKREKAEQIPKTVQMLTVLSDQSKGWCYLMDQTAKNVL